MNNNRNNANNNNNNRRRGRGNRNQGGGGGGGNQGNRIDSRARGNAPQMLDKFKKLAEDAHRHGDRVQAEYYLQFADHYFRVIADNRVRQEEPRGAQRSEREQDDFELEDENDPDAGRRYDSPRESARDSQRDSAGDGQRDGPREQRPRRDRDRDERHRPRYEDRASEGVPIEAEDNAAFEPDGNPFMREIRDDTAPRAKRAPRPRRPNGQEPVIDAAVLPPAFSANDAGDRDEAADAAPRRRRKRSDGETLSAVG